MVRVAVLGTAERAVEIAERIRAICEGRPFPVLEVRLLSDFDWFFEALEAGEVDYVLFLSAHAARALLRGRDPKSLVALRKAKVFAIGPGTGSKLREMGIEVDGVPEEHSSRGLIELLRRHDLRGKRVALPRVEGSGSALRAELEKLGAEVVEFPTYRLAPVESEVRRFLDALAEGSIDAAIFTCPSAVHAVLRTAEVRALPRIKIVAFGPATRQALRDYGIEPHVVPDTYSYDGIVEAVRRLG